VSEAGRWVTLLVRREVRLEIPALQCDPGISKHKNSPPASAQMRHQLVKFGYTVQQGIATGTQRERLPPSSSWTSFRALSLARKLIGILEIYGRAVRPPR